MPSVKPESTTSETENNKSNAKKKSKKKTATANDKGKSKPSKPASGSSKKASQSSNPERPVKYPKLEVEETQITASLAKELLGWAPAPEGVRKGVYSFGKKRVFMRHNVGNRPINLSHVRTLQQEILRKNWQFNCENVIVGKTALLVNGQHRLLALILAVEEWDRYPGKWKDYWQTEPVIDSLIVFGASEDDRVINTYDTGRPRTGTDVLYRSPLFADTPTADRKKLARICDFAVKVLWDRTGTKYNAYSPRRTHSELFDFLERHPRLVKCVQHIFQEDGADRGIGKFISPGAAAALMYLMGSSESDATKYRAKQNAGSDRQLDWSMSQKAADFWAEFSAGAKPLKAAKDEIVSAANHGGRLIDKQCAVIAKAWELFSQGHNATPKKVELVYETDGDGVETLAENPVVGGIDLGRVDRFDMEDDELVPEEEPEKPTEKKPAAKKKSGKKKANKKSKQKSSEPFVYDKTLEAKRAGDSWQVGDTAWVRDNEGDHFYGPIMKLYDTDDGKRMAEVTDAEGNDWTVAIGDLWYVHPDSKPKRKKKVPAPSLEG